MFEYCTELWRHDQCLVLKLAYKTSNNINSINSLWTYSHAVTFNLENKNDCSSFHCEKPHHFETGWGRVNINMSYQYRDPRVKDKTVSRPSITWESPYMTKMVFILRWALRISSELAQCYATDSLRLERLSHPLGNHSSAACLYTFISAVSASLNV